MSESIMAKIIPFPTTHVPRPDVPTIVVKTDFQYMLDKCLLLSRLSARSNGFIAGIIVANITNLIVQLILK